MPNNNPDGVNGFDGFGTEEPYGQQTRDDRLAAAAPLASGGIAAGTPPTAKASPSRAAKPAAPETPSALAEPAELSPAAVWAQLASAPGAENYPVLAELAART